MQRERPLILVVNDDESYLYLMHELLTDEQYDVLLCQTSFEAYPLATRHNPDLIMLDMRMEEPESGLKVLQLLRHNSTTQHIPVIMNSADHRLLADQSDRFKQLQSDMIEQPLSLDHVLTKIRQHLAASSLH